MPEKPDQWKSPEYYAEKELRTFKIYCDVHWTFGDKIRKPNRRPEVVRNLKPELRAWLDAHPFPHKLVLGGNGRSRIIFEQKAHAMLFKLTWI